MGSESDSDGDVVSCKNDKESSIKDQQENDLIKVEDNDLTQQDDKANN
jgi:hypothetical protein